MFQIKHGVALIALAYASVALADDLPEFNGEDIIVTASGVPQAKGIAPVSVSVITDKDITNSSASTVQDVLVKAGGIHLIKNGGTSAMVDLGGFGMTGSSNTLILVDGVKQNTNDQSAPNLGYIPLASIARIEIVRRSGSVQYGDGATGGVINIITKAGYLAQNHASLTQTLGSFNLRQTDANFNLAGERISLDGFAQSMNTDHYRDNSAERRDGGGLGLNWKLDEGSVRLYARTSSDSQGMAGSRKVYTQTGYSEFNSNPSGATSLTDHGNVKTNLLGLQANHKLGAGQLYVDLSTRDKLTSSLFGSYLDQRTLNEDSGSVRYVLPFSGTNQWLLGYDWLSGDANQSTGTQPSPLTTQLSAKQRHQGLFTEGQVDLWSGARATIGGRVQRIDDHVFGDSQDINSGQELHAWQLGLRQALGKAWSVYAKQGQSFRLPNSDDVAYTTDGLKPQTSRDQELGVEWSQGASSMHAAVFRSEVSNEIHYVPFALSPTWGANVNLSPTRHQGVELEGKSTLNSAFSVYGNLTWQQATYRSGSYSGVNLSGNAIPMVPSWLANLGVSWAASEQTRLNLEAQYVGVQHLDNDQSNQYVAQLAAYTVVNSKLTHQFSKLISGTFSINNLLDRHYATYGAVASSFAGYALYPADPRNYQASLTWAF